jgi:rhodanese-related sulfurtransferase
VKGYLSGGIQSWNGELETVRSVTASALKKELSKSEILDVRKPGEWSVSHARDARFVPLADMPSNLKSLDKEQSYVVHCGGGYRSMTAISVMRREGFKNLVNVKGGFGAMIDAGVDVATEGVEV